MAWSDQALDQLGQALDDCGDGAAQMRVVLQWGPMFKDDRIEEMPAHGWIRIDAEDMRRVMASWQADDVEGAATELLRAFLDRYPLEGAEPREVDVFELVLLPSAQ